MKRVYDDTISQEPSLQAAPASSGDADLLVQPFGSRTQSDKPAEGVHWLLL